MRSSHADARDLLLYAVTDSQWLAGRTLASCVSRAIAGGATFVQLREKEATRAERIALAYQLKSLCAEAHIPFVIDDDVQAALDVDADGVHVGQSDMACRQARRMLGPDKIVGVSVQTVDQALAAQEDGADYLGVGAMFATSTKADAADVSIDGLRAICSAVDIPVIAIGGLHPETIPLLVDTGIAGIAIVSGIFAAEDIQSSTEELFALAKRLRPCAVDGSNSSGAVCAEDSRR